MFKKRACLLVVVREMPLPGKARFGQRRGKAIITFLRAEKAQTTDMFNATRRRQTSLEHIGTQA